MLQLTQCKLPYREETRENLIRKAAHTLHLEEEEIIGLEIVKKSIDARKKPDIFVTYTVRFSVAGEERIWKRNRKNTRLSRVEKEPSLWNKIHPLPDEEKVVIVGAGPAGFFCAYYLSLCGLRPLLIERGAPMEERVRDVERFWREGVLNSESNVSFGEGGAGTFSDGKLNTGVKDKTGKKRFILESFVRFGADENILYDARPHIGTDVLQRIMIAMRTEMERLGCTFLFHTRMSDIKRKDGRLTGIVTARGGDESFLPADRLVLAIGHSARDTFSLLLEKEFLISQKAFAVGARVEHCQSDLDKSQYGTVDSMLPASSYQLTAKAADGRGVYSFCMCPGGYVVNASSEQGALVVNGMSNAKRDSGYANSAIVVTVSPEDFGSEHPLAGVEFQRRCERKMYALCEGRIPVQRYEDFVINQKTSLLGKVQPCVKGRWSFANLREALPKSIVNGMIEGMEQFAQRIAGFDDGDTLLLGLESRTSSPIRIERDENLESLTWKRIYPCGEGAGYAGGIMSAAMDGLRVAIKIQEKIQAQKGDSHAVTDKG